MKINIGCFNNLDSITMQDRYNETVYKYDINYHIFETDVDIPIINEKRSILCPVCNDNIELKIRNKKGVLFRQLRILFGFILTLPISLYFFHLAVNDDKGGFWVIAILFFIFGCILTGSLAFNLKKYESDSFISISNKNNFVKLDDRMKASKHKLFDENYKFIYNTLYLFTRLLYLLSIMVYLFLFYQIVITKNQSQFVGTMICLFIVFSVGIPVVLLIDFIYDKFFGKVYKIK